MLPVISNIDINVSCLYTKFDYFLKPTQISTRKESNLRPEGGAYSQVLSHYHQANLSGSYTKFYY
jgi:hypothetical protein